jgi:hypothetical protein
MNPYKTPTEEIVQAELVRAPTKSECGLAESLWRVFIVILVTVAVLAAIQMLLISF